MTYVDQSVCCRVVRKVPEVMEAFRELAPPLLNDRHHGVLLSGMCLALQICQLEPAAIPEYRIHVRLASMLASTCMWHACSCSCCCCSGLMHVCQYCQPGSTCAPAACSLQPHNRAIKNRMPCE